MTFPERCGTLLDNLPPPPQAQVCSYEDNFAAKKQHQICKEELVNNILVLQLDELEARRVLHLSQLKQARLAYLEEGTNQSSN